MPKLIATHEVDDVAHWLSSPRRVEVFGAVAKDIRTFVDPENPSRVGLSMDVSNMDANTEWNASIIWKTRSEVYSPTSTPPLKTRRHSLGRSTPAGRSRVPPVETQVRPRERWHRLG